MTSLFRPWTEGIGIGDKDQLASDVANGADPLQQDSTVSTTVSCEPAESPDATDWREVKYKNVKEHMRKRNEKYLQKKLRRKSSQIDYSKPLPSDAPACCPVSVPVSTLPPLHLSNIGDVPGFATIYPSVPSKSGDWCGDLKNNAELYETALAHGLPPSLVEEYARLLTEQQRHVSERNRKQRPKKFRCPHCQVGFSNNGQLKGHIRIHTGERPFKCDAESCGKSFTRNEELTRHRRIHSGLRPFPCPECGKRFGRKDHLKKHVKTHFQQRYQLVPILPGHYPYVYGF